MYLIVQFGEDVAIVPENWLDKNGTSAFWPPYKTDVRINKAALRKEPPSDGWSCETITKVLYKNENYEKVKAKLKRSENTSDLQTDDETVKRKRRPAKRLYETDSGADDDASESDDDQDGRSASKRPATTTCQSSSSTVSSYLSTTITATPPPATALTCPPATASTCRPVIATTSTAGNRTSTSLLLTPPHRIPTQALQASTPNSESRLLGPAAVTQILTAVEMMREEQREIKRLLQLVLSRGPAVEDQPCELPQGISFPIQSAEEMNEVDDMLVEADNLKSVVRYLSTFGGGDVREMVDRFLKETVSNEAAKLYNMKGLKGKRKFENLQLLNVLYRCVQRNVPTRTATRKDVQNNVTKWLTGSRVRAGGRKERVKRPVVQVTVVTPVNSDNDD